MATVIPEPVGVPLSEDEHGSIRVGETRVLLDVVIHEFRNGATPEEIVASYDALELADAYLLLGTTCGTPTRSMLISGGARKKPR
jgi:hypothetical protein